MKKFCVDVAVLLIFFNRPEKFIKVFEQVKEAKPSRLYLYQDGPREGRNDVEGITACRKILESIDWECEIHKNFQEKNVGCDPSEFNAIKWMFETETKGIILEDDDIPSISFFKFCKELLDKYENDTRIFKISGMNNFGIMNEEQGSYFFTHLSSIWGWATWKRCVDMYDTQYEFLDNDYLQANMRAQFIEFSHKIDTCRRHKATGKAYYESILWNTQSSNNMLNIVPSVNMITNIGIGPNGTHSGNSTEYMDKMSKSLFYSPRYEMTFPLRHPRHVIADMTYYKKMCELLGFSNFFLQKRRHLEVRWIKFKKKFCK